MGPIEPQSTAASQDEMQQHFKNRISCDRCPNNDSTKFTYSLPSDGRIPRDGRILVTCTNCNRVAVKSMEPSNAKRET